MPVTPASSRPSGATRARDEAAAEAWMRAYAAGDGDALQPLFDRYAPRLLGLHRHCVQEPAAAEELLRVTFAELHRLRRSYRPEVRLRCWLFGIAARVCLEALRRQERRGAAADSGDQAEPGVREALRALAGSQRVMLYLHRFEGMNFAEIAEVLGSSPPVVRRQLMQTYGSLHERLRPLVRRGEDP